MQKMNNTTRYYLASSAVGAIYGLFNVKSLKQLNVPDRRNVLEKVSDVIMGLSVGALTGPFLSPVIVGMNLIGITPMLLYETTSRQRLKVAMELAMEGDEKLVVQL
jgi:hypothetical protein